MMRAVLVDAAVVSALLGAGLAVTACLGRRSAAERHWLLAMCVTAALAAPLLRLAVPPSWAALVDVRPRMAAPLAPADATAAATTAPSPGEATTVRVRPATAAVPNWSWSQAALVGWLAGMAVALSRLAVGALCLRRLARAAMPIETGPWRATADALGAALSLRRPVRLLVTPHPTLLATWGWRRLVVALPAPALAWPAARIRAVLAHELGHVARGDWRHQILGELIRAWHWVNPLAWHVRRQLLAQSERASDDVALALGLDGTEYAAHLVDLARQLQARPSPWLPAAAMARTSSLEGRVVAMLDPRTRRQSVSPSIRALVVGAVVTATAPLALLAAASQYHALRGGLSDPSGRALPGAVVTLAEPTADRKYEVRADRGGRFEFVGLPPGTYRLEAKTAGFQTHSEDVVVAGDVERSLRLRVGTLQETITVIGDGHPAAPPDAETLARREANQQRASERQQRALATCAAGPPAAVGGNLLPPMKVVHVTPDYPAHLRPSGAAGTVTMRATIDRDGRVSDVQDVVAAHPDFAPPAIDAVRQWRFTTTLLNCEPIDVEMAVTVSFSTAP